MKGKKSPFHFSGMISLKEKNVLVCTYIRIYVFFYISSFSRRGKNPARVFFCCDSLTPEVRSSESTDSEVLYILMKWLRAAFIALHRIKKERKKESLARRRKKERATILGLTTVRPTGEPAKKGERKERKKERKVMRKIKDFGTNR